MRLSYRQTFASFRKYLATVWLALPGNTTGLPMMTTSYPNCGGSPMKRTTLQRMTIRLGLSLLVAAGWWVQRLPAQDPAPATTIPPASTLPAVSAPPVFSTVDGQYKSWIRRTLDKYGRCCAATPESIGCMSTHAELVFGWGSCRLWFGEPCLSVQDRREGY